MAVKIWTGATDGDWSVAGNWSPSGVPASADDVILSASYVVSITAGLNQSAVTLNSLTVEQGYSGAIGSKAADLQIATDALTLKALELHILTSDLMQLIQLLMAQLLTAPAAVVCI